MLPVTLQSPFGVQRRLTQRGAKRRVFVLGNVYWTFNLQAKIRLFGTLKMFYCDGVGSDGVGLDGNQKCPLIFFILRYIKHYTHIYLNMYKKIVRTNFLWV